MGSVRVAGGLELGDRLSVPTDELLDLLQIDRVFPNDLLYRDESPFGLIKSSVDALEVPFISGTSRATWLTSSKVF